MALKTIAFNDRWRFRNEWDDAMIAPEYDDNDWQAVELPHDWSVEGKFSIDAPSSCRGAYLPTGMGCYRKKFTVPPEMASRRAVFYFGGIFRNSEIYLNGSKIGGREWGYIPFEAPCGCDLNPTGENLLVVKVDNSIPMGCRWYAGSGIYRKVKLHFDHEFLTLPRGGFQITTPKISPREATLIINFDVRNEKMKRLMFHIRHQVFAPDGKCIADSEHPHWIGSGLKVGLMNRIPIPAPSLWTLENPVLYTLKTTLIYDSEIVDSFESKFGIRKMDFHPEKGFFLNGSPVKIKGVCLHNDGGALGAAVGKTSFLRQLRILKTMGCNAIRTSHHPFNEEFLDACDETGMLVLAEAFDEWSEPISVRPMSNGEWQRQQVHYYAHLFERCASRDLTDMILRDRNHPAIFMWSIGNEVPQMYKASGGPIAAKLREIVWNLDGSRPVTCAVVMFRMSHSNVATLDVGGYNYPDAPTMEKLHAAHPDQPMIITECHSAQTRRPLGKYFATGKLAELGDLYEEKLKYIRSFEDMRPGEEAWEAASKYPFVMGQFIWTGWDYLGEPTPYDYPAYGSFFGVIDRCGFPKDGYYYYRSVWRPEPLIHIASHWDFSEGDEADIRVITNCPQAELFRNGISLGVRTPREGFVWHVPFQPGKLEAVGETADGKTVTDRVESSGEPAGIELRLSEPVPGRTDLFYVECRIVDNRKHRVLNAEIPIRFRVSSAGKIKALDNGSQISPEPFQHTDLRHTCAGRCLCIVAAREQGPITLRAESPNLPSATLTFDPANG